jgi:hypothetical protein
LKYKSKYLNLRNQLGGNNVYTLDEHIFNDIDKKDREVLKYKFSLSKDKEQIAGIIIKYDKFEPTNGISTYTMKEAPYSVKKDLNSKQCIITITDGDHKGVYTFNNMKTTGVKNDGTQIWTYDNGTFTKL